MRITASSLAVLALALALLGGSASAAERQPIGRSVDGRPLAAWRQGAARPGFRVLVVGSIHGDERQGMRVVSSLRQRLAGRRGPKGIGLWTIRTVNPDGIARRQRQNARGVDLNRNFPFRWDGSLTGGYYSGPRPASEPETRAVMRLSRRVGFDLAIWFHQPWGRTLAPCNEDRRWAFLYARLSGLSAGGGCNRGHYPGSAVSWQHHTTRTVSFAVEFGPGTIRRAVIKRHTRAVVRLAKRMRVAG
ncbi:MAG: DUF2817 domain-containing protein [Solirubrobacterales bacterium]|nr:DUF2817 domain-containing protein [Solirubrobacterales bacterium]